MARRYLPDALRSEWSAGCRLLCIVSAKTRIPGPHLGHQMSKRALITGITGYVGRGVARRLLEDGFEIIGVVRNGEDNFEKRVVELRADLCELE